MFVLSFVSSVCAFAQTPQDTVPFYEMTLQQLMNVNVTVASQLPMTTRESPGIVTILTEEEIHHSGAKDITELFRMIPGFDFGVDVEGVVGIGVRGNWGHEGKVLMIWDGMEMNEEMYSTLQFGSHYPISQIKRIEIIRGPGSAMYGGNAEYAVINITTTNNRALNGVNAEVVSAAMSKAFSKNSVSVNAGKDIGALHVNASTIYNRGIRSQEYYTDRSGSSYNMTNSSNLTTMQHRVDVFYKNLSVTGFMDLYNVQQRDGYSDIYQVPVVTKFHSYYINQAYTFDINKFHFTQGLRLKSNTPWNSTADPSLTGTDPYFVNVKRTETYLNTSYKSDKLDVVAGFDYYNQNATQQMEGFTFYNGSRSFKLDNYAAFVQAVWKVSKINWIAGARYNDNSRFNSSFVPRVGITSVFDKWHMKVLYSQAFRSPSIENINVQSGILPERTAVTEAEIGTKLSEHSYLTVNVFDITAKDLIVYYYDENDNDRYKNTAPMGTRGIEVAYKWKRGHWLADFNYSFYTASGHTVIDDYAVQGRSDILLAFPQHKANGGITIPLAPNAYVRPYLSYISSRFAFYRDEAGEDVLINYNPAFYSGFTIGLNKTPVKGLEAQFTVSNIFNEPVYYIQPYSTGDHASLPGASREFQIKLRYNLEFSK